MTDIRKPAMILRSVEPTELQNWGSGSMDTSLPRLSVGPTRMMELSAALAASSHMRSHKSMMSSCLSFFTFLCRSMSVLTYVLQNVKVI